MAGELVVADQQMQLRDLLWGPSSSYCHAGQIPNWWGVDGMRVHDVARQATHGIRGGRDLLPSKIITGKVFTWATTRAALNDQVDAFMAGFAPSDDDLPLVVQFLDEKRRRYGRPRRAAPDTPQMTRFTSASRYGTTIAYQFDALDPFIYADTQRSASTQPPVPGAGFALPVTLPFTIPAGGSTGAMTVLNDGTMAAPWTARIDGPLTLPTITHTETGKQLQFTANGGLDIPAGDFVLLDSQARSVLYNGVGDRRLTLLLSTGWFSLVPGNNTVSLAANAGAGTLTIYWRDTYL